MTVTDEFGRAAPSALTSGAPPPPGYSRHSRHHHHPPPPSSYHAASSSIPPSTTTNLRSSSSFFPPAGSFSYSSSARSQQQQQQQQHSSYDAPQPPHNSQPPPSLYHHHHHQHTSSSPGYYYAPASSSQSLLHSSSSSPPGYGDRARGGGLYADHDTNASTRASASGHPPAAEPQQQQQDPSLDYVQDPLLCRYLWKKQAPAAPTASEEEAAPPLASHDHDEKSEAARDGLTKVKEERSDDMDPEAPKPSQFKEEEGVEKSANEMGDDIKDDDDNDEQQGSQSYAAYRRMYCLNYVRAFFNKHMDDSWFRARFSPAVRKQVLGQERHRALQEVQQIQQEITDALAHMDPGNSTPRQESKFVVRARLGGGVRLGHPASTGAPTTVRPGSSSLDTPAGAASEEKIKLPTYPDAHLFSWQQSSSLSAGFLYVQAIPPHVTNEQVVLAMLEYYRRSERRSEQSVVMKDLEIFSSLQVSVRPARNHLRSTGILFRDALVVGPPAVMSSLWRILRSHSENTDELTVPRKQDDDHHDTAPVKMDVDCTDPYGRDELDADGKGGKSPDGLPLPTRKAVVLVSPCPAKPSTYTLPAAVSSKARFAKDFQAACTMARALDLRMKIPEGGRLDELLTQLFGEEQLGIVPSDPLDVAIAYLRRVHLVSFYGGCHRADSLVDFLFSKHAGIYLRLENADASLEDSGGEKLDSKDLRAQSLDESISKALEECQDMLSSSGGADDGTGLLLDKATLMAAAEIEEAEKQAEESWLEDHSILEDIGRARCSFAGCNKLFRDRSFLHKHLLKKHEAFLRAEQAKCHDQAMMKAWDACENRPVPNILVDCGEKFGLVPVPVEGAIPDCIDPEPELWNREEQRLRFEAEERARREAERMQRQKQAAATVAEKRTFVDVDDMKEEKVELNFDNVDISAVVVAKKKKKRKLL